LAPAVTSGHSGPSRPRRSAHSGHGGDDRIHLGSAAARAPAGCGGARMQERSRRARRFRTVEIDTTDGPGFGFEHFKQHDFLQPARVG